KMNLKALCEAEAASVFDAYIYIFNRAKSIFEWYCSRQDILFLGELNKKGGELFTDGQLSVDEVYYRLAARLKHYLVDEFQDTSLLQWSIFDRMSAEMLSGEGLTSEHGAPMPTVFIVGDEKQSIYGFREADASLLREAADVLQKRSAFDVPLSDSYRTSQTILGFVNSHFRNRFDLFKDHHTAWMDGKGPVIADYGSILIAETFRGDMPGMPDFSTSATEREAEFVAGYIFDAIHGPNPLNVFDKAEGGYRRLKASDAALLYRASTHMEIFEKALRKRGIESRRSEGRGFWERPEIRDIMALARFISYPSDLLSLIAVLKSPLFGISDRDMLGLLGDSLKRDAPSKARVHLVLDLLDVRFPNIRAALKELGEDASVLSASAFLMRTFIRLSAFRKYEEAFGAREGLLAGANIQKFLEIGFELEKSGYSDICSLYGAFESLKSNRDIGNAPISGDAVNLMTIHKAKGLEFPFVALVETSEIWSKMDPYWVKGINDETGKGIYYIGTKDERPLKDPGFDRIMDDVLGEASLENLRLLYVALTRSREHLLITGSREKGSRKAAGFHGELWETAKSMGFEEKPAGETACIAIRKNPPDSVITNRKTENMTKTETSLPIEAASFRGGPPEIKTLAPHRLLHRDDHERGDEGVLSGQKGLFLREKGLFIHKGLELAVKKEPFDAAGYWNNLIDEVLERDISLSHLWAAEMELEAVLKSDAWNTMIRGASRVEAEKRILHLDGKNLILGSMDLYLEYPDGEITVVDYKTISPVSSLSEHELKSLIIDMGFDLQMAAYVKAVKKAMPGRKVNGVIYFTSINRALRIFPL
ncbi:MAG: UvrD-helicase domain-containing protein, partial [Oligoflexales bacterium]|nr:UvrD-helicase domain-containing protein [Oligoflexales bacterium]